MMMDGLAALSGVIWYGSAVLLLVIFVGAAIVHRKDKVERVVYLILSLLVVTAEVWIICDGIRSDRKQAKEYLGFYQLERLDGRACGDCRVRLDSNYNYLIFEKDKIAGRGKWGIGTNGEGPFLELDGEQALVSFDEQRVILGMRRKAK